MDKKTRSWEEDDPFQAEQFVSFILFSSTLPIFYDIDHLPRNSGWR